MLTLTEETILIPAGSVGCSCLTCGATIYFVPRPSGVRMPVEITADGDHHHPRIDRNGAGRPHLPHCHIGRK